MSAIHRGCLKPYRVGCLHMLCLARRVADTGLEPVYTAYEAGLEPPPVESALLWAFHLSV